MITCSTCGHEDPEHSRFCVDCGAPLVTGAVDEDRKLVTIIFAGLVSGPEPHLAEPEEPGDLLQAYQAPVSGYVEGAPAA